MKPIVLSLLNCPQRLAIKTKRQKELVVDILNIYSITDSDYSLDIRLITKDVFTRTASRGTLFFTPKDPSPNQMTRLDNFQGCLRIEEGYAGQLNTSDGDWLKFEVSHASIGPIPDPNPK